VGGEGDRVESPADCQVSMRPLYDLVVDKILPLNDRGVYFQNISASSKAIADLLATFARSSGLAVYQKK
jgi:hypothetical protein